MQDGTAILLCFLFVRGLTTVFPAGGLGVKNREHGFRCRAAPNRDVYGSRPATLNHVEQQIRDASTALSVQFLRRSFESTCSKMWKGVKDKIWHLKKGNVLQNGARTVAMYHFV
jgi:hypothetical protein